jgi:hypothetical protein
MFRRIAVLTIFAMIVSAVVFYYVKVGLFCSCTDAPAPKIADAMPIGGCPGR